jgi:hypothetical protein
MQENDRLPEGEPHPELIPLDVPVPPALTEVFGYRGQARFVGFHWEPSGDDVVFDDGRVFGTGDGWSFAAYRRHAAVAQHLEPYNLGYSDMDAMHALIIDRSHDLAGIIAIAEVRPFLKHQHPPPPDLSPEQLAEARHALEQAITRGWVEHRVDPEIVRQIMDERRQALMRMVSYLDQWPHV